MPQRVEFEGKVNEFPDDFSQEEISHALQTLPQPKTLFSLEGVKSVLGSIGPGLTKGILGEQLAGQEEIINSRDEAVKAGKRGPLTEEEQADVANAATRRKAIQESSSDLSAIQGAPSYPLQIAQGITQSLAQNLPGLSAAILARGTGRTAAIPALQGAQAMQEGQTYAESRVDNNKEIEPSLINAKVQGVTESAFEMLPTNYLIEKLGKEGFKKFVGHYVLKEWGTELPTTLAQDISDWATVSKDMPVGEFIHKTASDLLDTALITPFAAGATGAVAHGIAHVGSMPGDVEEGGVVAPGVNNNNNAALNISSPSTVATPPPWHWPTADNNTPDAMASLDAALAAVDPNSITPDQVQEGHAVIEAGRQAATTPVIPGAKEAWNVLDANPTLDSGELGASLKQTNNAGNYQNPNVEPRENRPIMFGPEGTEGLTPNQVVPQPATYVLGQESTDRSRDYLKAIYDTVEQWRQKWMPNSTMVISNEQLPYDNALGWHYSQNGAHLIVPAPLRRPSKGMGSFNANTQASAFYNLTHEFGHALTEAQFYQGAQPMAEQLADRESQQGTVSEQTVALFPEAQQAIIREFNALKQAVTDGTISAADFVNTWMSPGKVGRKNILEGVDPAGPATALVQRIASQASKDPTQSQAIASSLLSLKEYLAEQMARHAYATKLDQGTPIGQFFAKALASLRAFFVEQKRDGKIGPGVAFTSWIEGLTQTEHATNRSEQAANASKSKAPVTPVTSAVPTGPPPPTVQRVQHNVETSTHEQKMEQGKGLIGDLFDNGQLDLNSPDAKRMMGLLLMHDYDEFVDLYKKYSGRKVQFELKEPGGNWEQGSAEELAEPIVGSMTGYNIQAIADNIRDGNELTSDTQEIYNWATQASQRYLNKYAATAKDPLHNVEIPFEQGTIPWGKAFQGSIAARPAWIVYSEEEVKKGNKREYEPIFSFYWSEQHNPERGFQRTGVGVVTSTDYKRAIRNYLQHVGDYLRERVPAAKLSQYDLVRAVKETAAWDKELARNMQKAREAEKTASPIYKQYPDGMYWQQLTQPGRFARESDVMGHSVRGYEPPTRDASGGRHPDFIEGIGEGGHSSYGLGGWEAIKRGDAKVYSLRDAKGESHVTVEVNNANQRPGVAEMLERQQLGSSAPSITQIKGKQNRTPSAEYLPYVQDFVKSGTWGEVGNLENTGLYKIDPELVSPGSPLQGQQYATSEELTQATTDGTYSPRPPTGHFDLDDSPQQQTFLKGLTNFLTNPAPLRMALRKFTNAQFNVLEFQQLAHIHPENQNGAYFSENIIKYNSGKASLQAGPDHVVHVWEAGLGKTNWSKVDEILFAEADGKELWWGLERPSGEWQYEMSQRAYEEMKARGVDANTLEGQEIANLVLSIKNELINQTNTTEKILRKLIASRLPNASQEALMKAFMPLLAKVHEYRKYPFFPQGRFGKWMLVIERHKTDGGWETVHREAFEKKSDRDEAHALAFKNKAADERVSIKELTDQTYVLMSIPTDFVELAASELDLSDKEVEVLQGLLQPIKPEKAFTQQDLSRLGIKGHSMDAMRTFANYTWHNANMLAKLEYRAEFNRAMRGVKAELRVASMAGPQAELQVNLLTHMYTSMERTRDYLMAPPYEAQGLRATVALLYLGLNIKTAALNTFGLMTTWSDLTSTQGLGKGTVNFGRGLKQAWSTIRLTDLNAQKPSNLPPMLQKALDQAIKEGVLSQSYAYHLAGVANSGNLFRMPSKQLYRRYSKKLGDAAMYAFRLTELGTRRATFLTVFEQEMSKPGGEFQKAYDESVRRTNLLQNDYSLGNRVPFMRGVSLGQQHPLGKFVEPIIPLATVFMSFAQHMAFHAYGGYELGERRSQRLLGQTPRTVWGGYTMKLAVIFLALAGYEGLPGASDLLNLVEFLWRKFGGNEPIRQKIREYVQSIEFVDLDPQLFAHGLGHNFAGFDISRSVGLGQLVPGTDALTQQETNFNATTGLFVFDLFGATGSIAKWGLESLYSGKPLSQTLQHAPGALGNVWTAYQWSQYGVRAPSGGVITHDQATGRLRDLTAQEIAGKALGFNPTEVAQAREIRWEQYDRQIYWTARQKSLLDDIWTARWQGDKEGETDARKAVQDYNASIPPEYRTLRITGKTIAESLHAKLAQKKADEAQTSTKRKFKPIYEDVKKSLEP